jgi:glycosyltransferase involved in cell wall biosynthesis
MVVGALLVVGPVVYAAVWAWLRGGVAASAGPPAEASPVARLAEPAPAAGPLFSVLIAARDEAAALPHLLRALGQQTLAAPQFEVLIADDHSTDGTAALVAAAAKIAPFGLRLVALPPGATGKKAALAAAIAQARAPWVVCTDADCRPGPGWLRAYADLLQNHARTHSPIHFVSGPVRLTPGGAWFDGLLRLEFAGLVGVGSACIARGRPTMCNGANLAFRRGTFHEVGGYADNAGLASGDDEFLLHKLHQRYPAGVRFLADTRAVVDTPAPATWRALLRQRVRWASKYPHYRTTAPRQLALLVLGTNLSLFIGLVLALIWPALGPWTAAGWGIKLGADAWLLAPTLRLLRRGRWLAWLLPLQLLYAPYALAVGLAGQRAQGYRWKGRQVR